MSSKAHVTNDLFITTLHELHCEAPVELLRSLRARLEQIKLSNPNCAQTAEACLDGLASDKSSLLHVLTAAYLINGGVMIKHSAVSEEERSGLANDCADRHGLYQKSQTSDLGGEFDSLEEELNKFSISIEGDLKPRSGSTVSRPLPKRSQEFATEPSESF